MNKFLFKLLCIPCLLTSFASHAMEVKTAESTPKPTLYFDKHNTDQFSPADNRFFKSGGNKELEQIPARFKFGYRRQIVCYNKPSFISYRVRIPNQYLESKDALVKDTLGNVQIFFLSAPDQETQTLLLDQALTDAWKMHEVPKPVLYCGSNPDVIAFLKSVGFIQEQTADGKTTFMKCDLQKFIEKKLKGG